MLGWERLAAICASRLKRARSFGSSALRNLRATHRLSSVSSAFQTSPMPPEPSFSVRTYLPKRVAGSSVGTGEGIVSGPNVKAARHQGQVESWAFACSVSTGFPQDLQRLVVLM